MGVNRLRVYGSCRILEPSRPTGQRLAIQRWRADAHGVHAGYRGRDVIKLADVLTSIGHVTPIDFVQATLQAWLQWRQCVHSDVCRSPDGAMLSPDCRPASGGARAEDPARRPFRLAVGQRGCKSALPKDAAKQGADSVGGQRFANVVTDGVSGGQTTFLRRRCGDATQRRDKLSHANRLADVVVHTRGKALLAITCHGSRRHCHDPWLL